LLVWPEGSGVRRQRSFRLVSSAGKEPSVTSVRPTENTRWRCRQCGNLTRFDVVRRARIEEFVHVTLAGEPTVEESTVLEEVLESVRCRWCGGTDTVELVERPHTVPVADST
jgi:hypothetical protein